MNIFPNKLQAPTLEIHFFETTPIIIYTANIIMKGLLVDMGVLMMLQLSLATHKEKWYHLSLMQCMHMHMPFRIF